LEEAELWALLEAYLATYGGAGARISGHTLRSYRKGLGVLLAYCGRRGESLIRPGRDLGAAYLRELEAAKLSASTVRVRLASARMLYKALRWAGATEADPFRDAKVAKDKTAPWDKRSPYSHEEVVALLMLAKAKDRVLVLLGAHGGLRVEEIVALCWEDVDLNARVLTVREGKGGKSRRVNLSASLLEALVILGPSAGRMLAFTTTRARARLKALAERAGVAYKGVHALRHYAGTRLARETGDLEHVARHLGHSSLEMARIYAKWSDEGLKRAVGGGKPPRHGQRDRFFWLPPLELGAADRSRLVVLERLLESNVLVRELAVDLLGILRV
jgi:integrase